MGDHSCGCFSCEGARTCKGAGRSAGLRRDVGDPVSFLPRPWPKHIVLRCDAQQSKGTQGKENRAGNSWQLESACDDTTVDGTATCV